MPAKEDDEFHRVHRCLYPSVLNMWDTIQASGSMDPNPRSLVPETAVRSIHWLEFNGAIMFRYLCMLTLGGRMPVDISLGRLGDEDGARSIPRSMLSEPDYHPLITRFVCFQRRRKVTIRDHIGPSPPEKSSNGFQNSPEKEELDQVAWRRERAQQRP